MNDAHIIASSLRKQAEQISEAGHAGWGNLDRDAADLIEQQAARIAALESASKAEPVAFHGCEPSGFAADCNTHTYAVQGLGVVVLASNFNALLSKLAAPTAALESASKDAIRREALEEAVKVCEDIAVDRWNLYKGRHPYNGSEDGRANSYVEGESDGADKCADAIRALSQKVGDQQ